MIIGEVDDLDHALTRIKEAGVPIEYGPVKEPWGVRRFYVRDPWNLLWLGVAWECIDGYMAGPPKFIQKVFLGGLAKLAKWLGYRI